MSEPERIGVLGGTFDPLHNAHLDMARAALEAAHLDRVLFVVSARPPHKDQGPIATPEQRLAMVTASLESQDRMEATDIEFHRPGPSYTTDTLTELEGAHPGAHLFLVIGFDSLLDLPNWRDPEGLLEKARLLVLPRPGNNRPVPEHLRGAYELLPFQETGLSSTDVRRRVAAREPVDRLVPPPVLHVIHAQRPYHSPFPTARAGEFIALLQERLPQKTLRHTLAATETMLSFAHEISATQDQLVTTGLLHDLCKAMRGQELLAAAAEYGLDPSPFHREKPNLLHGCVAAEECKRKLEVHDPAVYDAIYWHTTGRPHWNDLGLALYVADFSEPLRAVPQSAEARHILYTQGFEAALHYVVRSKLHYIQEKYTVDPMSREFGRWIEEERAP